MKTDDPPEVRRLTQIETTEPPGKAGKGRSTAMKIDDPSRGRRRRRMSTRHTDDVIARLAAGQHGLVSRRQLLDAGVGVPTIDYRVKAARLVPVQLGVYRVGPLKSRRAKEMAAVLACGPDTVVSHRSAASLWEVLPPSEASAAVDVIVPDTARRSRSAVRVHQASALGPDDVAEVDGIPVTAPVRTLLDLASAVGPRELERALARAEREALASRLDLRARLDRCRGRRGIRALRALLEVEGGPAFTRSEAEARLLDLIRRASLPVPEVNVRLGSHEVDFHWRRERVVVEVDGFAYHAAVDRFEGDRRRDAELSARGIQVLRVTWRQLVTEPEAVLVRLAQTLVRSGS